MSENFKLDQSLLTTSLIQRLDHGTAKTIKELYNYDLTAERERKWMAC